MKPKSRIKYVLLCWRISASKLLSRIRSFLYVLTLKFAVTWLKLFGFYREADRIIELEHRAQDRLNNQLLKKMVEKMQDPSIRRGFLNYHHVQLGYSPKQLGILNQEVERFIELVSCGRYTAAGELAKRIFPEDVHISK